jgi:spermidine synthase
LQSLLWEFLLTYFSLDVRNMAGSALRKQPSVELKMAAAFLFECGVIHFNEPQDTDPDSLLGRLVDGSYGKAFVVDNGKTRCLHFSLAYVQSEMSLAKPGELTLAYTRKMMAFLLFLSRPKHVVLVGLGGGSLVKFCHRHLPRAKLTTLEIDPDVIALSPLFHVPQNDERAVLVHADAVTYLASMEERVDVILLDGCDNHGVAPVFCDPEVYRNLRTRLRPSGMLVMNLVGSLESVDTHIALLATIFDGNLIIQDVNEDGNRVAYAFNDAAYVPDWPAIERDAKLLEQRYGLDFSKFAHKLQRSYQRQSRKASF